MTNLIDRRPEAKRVDEQCELRNKLCADICRMAPSIEPEMLDDVVAYIMMAQRAGIIELYLQEFEFQSIRSRMSNCPVLNSVFSMNKEFTFGQKIILSTIALSADRDKLMQDMVLTKLNCACGCFVTDSVQRKEVDQSVDRVLRSEPSEYMVNKGGLKAFCSNVLNAFKLLIK